MRFSSNKRPQTVHAALGFTLVISVACSNGTGTCNFVYVEPLFTISSATNSVTNGPIPQVRISALRVDNVSVPVTYLSEVSVAHDVTVEGDQLLCTVDCGFAATPGAYQFTVSGAGYRDTSVTVAATYLRTDNSCPVRVSGGVQLNLTLSPQ